MGYRSLVLVMFLGALWVAQALKCKYCQKIDKHNPTCDTSDIQEKVCSNGFDRCITITMSDPAYGEVRRCAKSSECDKEVPKEVTVSCCKDDACN